MKLTTEKANELFTLLFRYYPSADYSNTAMKVLPVLGVDINDVIEAADFKAFSGKSGADPGYAWLHNREGINKNERVTFLEQYFLHLTGMITFSEKSLFKIFNNTHPEDLQSSINPLVTLARHKEFDEIIPQSLLTEILKITNYETQLSRNGMLKNFLFNYTQHLSLQEPQGPLKPYQRGKPLLNPEQLKQVIEKSEVVLYNKYNVNILANLVEFSNLGPIADDMQSNFELILKKINPSDYDEVFTTAIATLTAHNKYKNMKGVKLLDRVNEYLGVEWREYISPQHVRVWDDTFILAISYKKNSKAQEAIIEGLKIHHNGAEILEKIRQNNILYEKEILSQEIDIKEEKPDNVGPLKI